ncbi:putative PEP-binding protein [Escherichia coli]
MAPLWKHQRVCHSAEGVGLFRDQTLYMDWRQRAGRAGAIEAYQQVLLAAGDKPIIFRTMDIGGDKSTSLLDIPQEENPFLRLSRGRIYPEFVGWLHHLNANFARCQFWQRPVDDPMVHSLDQILLGEGEIQKAIVELGAMAWIMQRPLLWYHGGSAVACVDHPPLLR